MDAQDIGFIVDSLPVVRVNALEAELQASPSFITAPASSIAPGCTFPIGTREDYTHDLHHSRSQGSLEPEEPPEPPPARLLLAFCRLLSLSAGLGRAGKGIWERF